MNTYWVKCNVWSLEASKSAHRLLNQAVVFFQVCRQSMCWLTDFQAPYITHISNISLVLQYEWCIPDNSWMLSIEDSDGDRDILTLAGWCPSRIFRAVGNIKKNECVTRAKGLKFKSHATSYVNSHESSYQGVYAIQLQQSDIWQATEGIRFDHRYILRQW